MTDLSDCPYIQLPLEGRGDLRQRLEASRNAHLDLARQDPRSDPAIKALFQVEIENSLIECLFVDQGGLRPNIPFSIISRRQEPYERDPSGGVLQVFKEAWQQVSSEVASWVPPSVQAQ